MFIHNDMQGPQKAHAAVRLRSAACLVAARLAATSPGSPHFAAARVAAARLATIRLAATRLEG